MFAYFTSFASDLFAFGFRLTAQTRVVSGINTSMNYSPGVSLLNHLKLLDPETSTKDAFIRIRSHLQLLLIKSRAFHGINVSCYRDAIEITIIL